jgi:hypothetical protein
MKYPKAFEKYWGLAYAHIDVCRHMSGWESAGVKEVAYLAWKAGRRHQHEQDSIAYVNGLWDEKPS